MKKKGNKGFTLLEVLVSIIIIGIVLICVVVLTNSSSSASSKAKLNNNIAYQVESILDEFSVAPSNFTNNEESLYKKKYFDELFITESTDARTNYYLEITVTRTKYTSHTKTYDITIIPYVENEKGEAEKYEIFGYDKFDRTVREEV